MYGKLVCALSIQIYGKLVCALSIPVEPGNFPVGKCPANRNVLCYVQILAQWVFVVDVTRGVRALDVSIGWALSQASFSRCYDIAIPYLTSFSVHSNFFVFLSFPFNLSIRSLWYVFRAGNLCYFLFYFILQSNKETRRTRFRTFRASASVHSRNALDPTEAVMIRGKGKRKGKGMGRFNH